MKQFTSNFKSTYKRLASIEEVKACIQQHNETLRSYIQRWSIIKNSAVEVSDERAIDAFALGLRRGDLVEEMGRIKPRTVSELMDIEIGLQTAKTCVTTRGHNHQKMTGEADTTFKGVDPATTTITALSVDFVSQEHGVPHEGPKDSNAGGCTREI
jgi:hypothetical protein